MSLTGSDRIFQIHPTRRCNLRCLHCYSDSSPEATDELPADLATRLVVEAAALGYTVASVSGGEPFLYRALPEVLGAAKQAGMRTQVVSNGLAVTASRLDAVQPVLDLLAVSIDGVPADHDRMRGLSGSFRRLDERLALVRDRGVPFGLLFTLTMWNVHELEWAVDYALSSGARLLQVHPLEASGRAVALADDVPDEREAAMAMLEGLRLQARVGGDLAIHIDVALASQLLAAIGGRCDDRRPLRISDVVSPLVVEPDGMCVPLEYGFPRQYALGDVRSAGLGELAGRWLDDVWPSFGAGLDRMREDLGRRGQSVVVNPYAMLRNTPV
jgi:MoaA/NifB/PqqE/SkfB family radical SAM enzyme